MMKLKVLSTFFQSAELTTLIEINWPTIVSFSLPFQLPMSDAKCLATSSGWTQNHTFYAFIYVPLLAFGARFINPGFAERKRATGMMIIVLSLWYSPMLQMIGSMFICFKDTEAKNDPDRLDKHFLVSDPLGQLRELPLKVLCLDSLLSPFNLRRLWFPCLHFLEDTQFTKS